MFVTENATDVGFDFACSLTGYVLCWCVYKGLGESDENTRN